MVRKMLKDIEWTQRDRVKIRVIEMSNNHIQNCINLLNTRITEEKLNGNSKKKIKAARKWIKIFEFEQKRRVKRSDMLVDFLEDEEIMFLGGRW